MSCAFLYLIHDSALYHPVCAFTLHPLFEVSASTVMLKKKNKTLCSCINISHLVSALKLFVAARQSLSQPCQDYGILHSNLIFTLSSHQRLKLFIQRVQ